jgi:hypothetical protein
MFSERKGAAATPRKEHASQSIMLNRAFHEAGHAVFLWRGGETIHKDRWLEGVAPFEAVILSP